MKKGDEEIKQQLMLAKKVLSSYKLSQKIRGKKNSPKHYYYLDIISYAILGIFIGYRVDKYLNSPPIFIIVCTVLSFVIFFAKLFTKNN